jgi:hypothetical protein
MDQKLLLAILTSSLLAAIFTKLFDYWFAVINYKRDYYKKIIEERLKAYQLVNSTLNQITTTYNDLADPSKRYYGFFLNKYEFWNNWDRWFTLQPNILWYSIELRNHIQEYVQLFIEYTVKHNITRESLEDDVYINMGIELFHKVEDKRTELLSLINQDLLKIHDVKSFLKGNIKYKTLKKKN